MPKTVRTLGTLAIAVALLAVPATAVAAKGGQGKAKSCKTTPKVGYHVKGTLVTFAPNTVTITVTSANSHARKSGEIADPVVGATYTVPASDAFELKLHGFEGADTPSAGDTVKVSGRIPRTKSRCAAEGATTADRYLAPDVRRVSIWDVDADV